MQSELNIPLPGSGPTGDSWALPAVLRFLASSLVQHEKHVYTGTGEPAESLFAVCPSRGSDGPARELYATYVCIGDWSFRRPDMLVFVSYMQTGIARLWCELWDLESESIGLGSLQLHSHCHCEVSFCTPLVHSLEWSSASWSLVIGQTSDSSIRA